MIRINLLPGQLVQQQLFEQRLKFWIIIWIVAGITAAIPWIAYASAVSKEAFFEEKKEQVAAQLQKLKGQTTSSESTIRGLQTSLARAEALRTKRSWDNFFTYIVHAMPAGMWFTDIETRNGKLVNNRTEARSSTRSGRSKRNQAAEAAPIKMIGASDVVIQGYALDHNQLYRFISNLSKDELFKDVDLVNSGTELIDDYSVIRFKIKCDW